MTVNSLKRTKFEEDEAPLNLEFADSSIQLVKKNMKIPSSIKLVGYLTDKSFDIMRKTAKMEGGPLLRIMFSQSIQYEIIRHSTTGLIIRDKIPAKEQDTYYINEVEFSLESSYQRDLFALTFKELTKMYLDEISKYDLKEIDFYKRRETYLEKQMSNNQAKYNQEALKIK